MTKYCSHYVMDAVCFFLDWTICCAMALDDYDNEYREEVQYELLDTINNVKFDNNKNINIEGTRNMIKKNIQLLIKPRSSNEYHKIIKSKLDIFFPKDIATMIMKYLSLFCKEIYSSISYYCEDNDEIIFDGVKYDERDIYYLARGGGDFGFNIDDDVVFAYYKILEKDRRLKEYKINIINSNPDSNIIEKTLYDRIQNVLLKFITRQNICLLVNINEYNNDYNNDRTSKYVLYDLDSGELIHEIVADNKSYSYANYTIQEYNKLRDMEQK